MTIEVIATITVMHFIIWTTILITIAIPHLLQAAQAAPVVQVAQVAQAVVAEVPINI